MATFDYATPLWADDEAVAATNIQTLGRLASTITDITMSMQTSAAAVLPKRRSDGVDYSYSDLLFLQRYVFTHMSLMDYETRTELAELAGLGGEFVLVHTGWLRQIADVMETMAHQLTAGRFAHQRIQANGVEATAQDWVNDLRYQAKMAVHMADEADAS